MASQLAFEFPSRATAPRPPDDVPSRAAPSAPDAGRVLLTPPLPAKPTGSPRLRLETRMSRTLRVPVRLVLTDNRRTMISTKRGEGARLEVRLHRMFVEAPESVIEELLCYLSDRDPRASAALRRYVRENRGAIQRPPRRILLRTKGAHHDLAELLEEVVEAWIPEGADGVSITWGRRPNTKRRRRSIRLGTYTHDQELIRIHPALDMPDVPRFFVAFVVFHEVLHHVVPARQSGGRMLYHPPEFRARERRHPDFERATKWETDNLDRLLEFR